jgi:hypothetical protein
LPSPLRYPQPFEERASDGRRTKARALPSFYDRTGHEITLDEVERITI